MLAEEAALRRAADRPAIASSDFDLNPGIAAPARATLRPAAVLVAVLPDPRGPRLLLTKRSSHLKHHPGQIALPGGKIEPDEPGPEAAALREAQEEVGLPPEQVQVLGRLPPHVTVTGFSVTPVLGLVHGPVALVAQDSEVAEVFSVPLSHVTDPARFRVEGRRWQGQMRRYYVVPWGPYYIWGATARILRALAQGMAP